MKFALMYNESEQIQGAEILAIKDKVDDLIPIAMDKLKELVEANEPGKTLEQCFEEKEIWEESSNRLLPKNVKAWQYNDYEHELYIQKVEI